MAETTARDLVTVNEGAAHAGVNHQTIRRRIADGSLTAYRFGPRLLKVSLAEIDALLMRVDAS